MASNSSSPMKVVEVCHISPSLANSHDEFSIPVTYFDTYWLKFHPVERLYFYEIPELTTQSFRETVFPNLKDSLSITLSHFIPFAATLFWTAQESKPFLHYTPGDSVLFTVAESNISDHFDILSGDDVFQASECRYLVPNLDVSVTKASSAAFQVTVFPNKGLCIGVTTHHAVADGKSSTMFMKAWAHLCSELGLQGKDSVSLPQELAPFINRDIIKDFAGIESLHLNMWINASKGIDPSSNPGSLKLIMNNTDFPESLVRCTFRLTKKDINTLRNKVFSWQGKLGKEKVHLSTFCISIAHVLVCMVKAIGTENIKRPYLLFTADFRARLDPPVPTNYFGNCVWGRILGLENEHCIQEDGVATVAEKIRDAVKDIGKKDLEGAKESMSKMEDMFKERGNRVIGLAGSSRFEVYKTDYGWGRPKKVEIVSVDRGGSIAVAENIDESCGIQFGIVLNKAEMEVFASEFQMGLNNSP